MTYSINKSMLKVYIIFLITILPIFVNLNFSSGIRFDANPFNLLGAPSLPLSSFMILFLFLFNLNILLKNKLYLFFLLSSFLITVLSVMYGNLRIIIIFFEMNMLLISFYIFSYIFKNYDNNILMNNFYKILAIVVIIKFIFDILIFKSPNSPFFISEKIAIYNYYDYFPFVYFLAGILSLQNIYSKKIVVLSLLVFIISLVSLLFTTSRLFTGAFFLIPILLLLYKFIKINKKIIFCFYFLLVIVITIFFANYPTIINDNSLIVRFSHWYHFFKSMEVVDLLLPFMNEYRMSVNGSFHNEFLEIVSFFGLVSFLFFFQVYKLFTENILNQYSIISKLLIFVFTIGMVVQLNLLDPYLSVNLALFLSIIKHNKDSKCSNL